MALLPALLLMLAAAQGDAHPAALVGQYDGSQMEIAAGLELRADGRFHYELGYGALDEQADGLWHVGGGEVILDSDPVKAPLFMLVDEGKAPADVVQVGLQVPPGMDVQYFDAAILLADGTAIGGQLSTDGLSLPLKADQHPASVRVALSMYEIASDPVMVDAAKGLSFHFRFEPNDLGHVAFRGTTLGEDKGDLVLARFGRTIRFKRGAN